MKRLWLCLAVPLLTTTAICQQPVETSVTLKIAKDSDSPVRINKVRYSIERDHSPGDIVLELENTSPLAVEGVFIEYFAYIPAACSSEGTESLWNGGGGDGNPSLPGFRLIRLAPHETVTFVDRDKGFKIAASNVLHPGSRYARVEVAIIKVAFTTGNQWQSGPPPMPKKMRLASDDETCAKWKWMPEIANGRGDSRLQTLVGSRDRAPSGSYENTAEGVSYSCVVMADKMNCPSWMPKYSAH